MEARPDSRKTPDRWYLHVQGRTLGPLAGDEVVFGLKTGEFLPADKIAHARHPIWRRISEHPHFGQCVAQAGTPRSAHLKPLPSPHLLRIKVAPPPVPAAVAPAPSVERSSPAMEEEPPAATPENKLVFDTTPPAATASLLLENTEKDETAKLEDELFNDPETNAALEAATKELERVLSTLRDPVPAPSAPQPREPQKMAEMEGIPDRPKLQPIFLAEPAPRSPKKPQEPRKERKVLRFEFKLPERPLLWLAMVLAVFGISYFAGSFVRSSQELPGTTQTDADPADESKTRDLKEFPLPDPSSPTNKPSETGDPVPPLKAPTRPRRD